MAVAAWLRRQARRLLFEVAAIRRQQILMTIDPELAGRLRAAAKLSRVPMSALIEDRARRVLGLDRRREARRVVALVPPLATKHSDLFDGLQR